VAPATRFLADIAGAAQGLSGYNSRWALDMLQGERLSVDAARVRLATVVFGASTCAHLPWLVFLLRLGGLSTD
jgi:hypothetical protein